MDNYSGLGLEAFQKLERGETVELKKPDLALDRGFVKKQTGDK